MNRIGKILLFAILILFPLITASGEYRSARGEKKWKFPEDHGAHPDFRTEWWYFTGHLKGENSVYGFELTFFRFANNNRFAKESEWSARQYYLTHFTVTDEAKGKFYKYETLNRGTLGIAGSATDSLNVWSALYSARLDKNGNFIISASNPEINLRLTLIQTTDVVLNGNDGLSRKGPNNGEASYYYSVPRLEGKGSLEINKKNITIKKASVWMDREFFTIQESRNQGWDWFAIQLDNGSNLMLYRLRDNNGNKTRFSSGTYINKIGQKKILNPSDFRLIPLSYWKSRSTGIRYPVEWRIVVSDLNLDLKAKAVLNNQELVLEKLIKINYWEGRATVNGSDKGRAYIELVGYSK